jgi:hypothetical protein
MPLCAAPAELPRNEDEQAGSRQGQQRIVPGRGFRAQALSRVC